MADLGFGDDGDEVRDSRFVHLLKGVRDLAENFSIDLATELEDYLEQLEHAQFAFTGGAGGSTGGARAVDFAEAALLIQGSTCVYSKKVEYLYNLVYQALEAVKGKKKQQDDGATADGTAGTAGARSTARNAAADDDDCLAHFWEVDQTLQEANDIDLAPDQNSSGAMAGAVRVPAALLALEDHGTSAATGAQGQQQGDGDAGVYRLQRCYVHVSGALLLDARDGDMYDHRFKFIGPAKQRLQPLDLLLQLQQQQQLLPPAPLQLTQPPAAQQASTQGAMPPARLAMGLEAGPHAAMHDAAPEPMVYDDDGGGGGYDGGDWDADGPAAGPSDHMGADGDIAMADGQQLPAAGEQGSSGDAGHAPARRHRQQHQGGAVALAGRAADDLEPYDPYKPLDPTDKGNLPIKPLQVKRPRKNRPLPVFVSSTASAAAGSSYALSTDPQASGLCLPEFSYAFAFLHQKGKPAPAGRAGKRKGKAGQRSALGFVAQAFDATAELDEAGEADAGAAPPDQDDNPWAEPLAAGTSAGAAAAACGGDDDDGPGGGDEDGFGGHSDDGWDHSAEDDRCRGLPAYAGAERLAPWLDDGLHSAGEHADSQDPTYEELCRAHIESLIQAAAAREVQSDLARRVSSWRQRIGPVLQAEETRASFDIQDYGDRLLGKLSSLQIVDEEGGAGAGAKEDDAPAGFGVVSVGLLKYEVSRMFAAMLQLVNNRNVAILKADAPDQPFRLRLLSTNLYHKSMGERLAAVPANQHQLLTQGQADVAMSQGEGGAGADENAGRGGKARGGKRARKGGAAAPLSAVNAVGGED